MIMDAKLQFSDQQAITVTAPSSNIIDLGVERDVGIGRDLDIDCRVTEAFLAAGAGTLTITLETAIDAAFTVPIVLASTPAIPKASLVIGYEPMRFEIMSPTNRYVRLNFTVATGPFTAGKISAAVVVDRQANRAYPSGYTIGA